MRKKKEIYEAYTEDDTKFEDYIERMSADGCWGGEQEITALCELLNINVIIYRVC
jgi:hypothetical protein